MTARLACFNCGWDMTVGVGRGNVTQSVLPLLCCGKSSCPWGCFAIMSRERADEVLAGRVLEVVGE